LAAVSVQDLKPNSQDTSAFYLGNIYQLLADPNISRESILATPAQPPPFSPPKSAVLVNSLWFLSLVISLTCALLATMLQQWARRYVTITQPPLYSPHKRAPIRAFFAHGVNKFHLPWSVEALPALLHLSLFLFFSGLGVFLFNINHTVFSVVIWWVGLAGAVYGCVTWMPIFWNDSPYYSPLSSSAWLFYTGIQYAVTRVFDCYCPFIPSLRSYIYGTRFVNGMTKAIQDTGEKLSVKINRRILTWTIHSLDEDKDLEQFVEAIPGFCRSEAVCYSDPDLDLGTAPQLAFTNVDRTLAHAFAGFMDRTLTSSSVLQADKKRRIIICMKAADSAHLTYATMSVLGTLFSDRIVLRSVEFGRYLRSSDDGDPGLCSQGLISGVIANVPERDDLWFALAREHLDLTEEVLQNYLANGDSVLLANFIHITRPLFHLFISDPSVINLMGGEFRMVLQCIFKFDIEKTLPKLQHDFCALWNEIVREAHIRESCTISLYILATIQHLYIALHQGTDAASNDLDIYEPSSYPLCTIPNHHPDSAIGEIPDRDLTSPSTEPVSSSFPASSADHRRIHFAEQILLLDATPIAESFHHTPPINVEKSSNDLTTSLNLITQGPTDTTSITFSPTSGPESSPRAPGVSTFTLRSSDAPQFSDTTDPHKNVDLGVASGILLSSSPGRASVPSDMAPATTQSSLASLAFRNDRMTTAPDPLPLPSTSATATPAPLEGTSVVHPTTTPNDGTLDDLRDPILRCNLDVLEQSQESAMSVPEVATDVLRHPVGTPPVSRDIDHSE
jgi:Family of unknown function (DUF6535)